MPISLNDPPYACRGKKKKCELCLYVVADCQKKKASVVIQCVTENISLTGFSHTHARDIKKVFLLVLCSPVIMA